MTTPSDDDRDTEQPGDVGKMLWFFVGVCALFALLSCLIRA
jgi:hypothetical protein